MLFMNTVEIDFAVQRHAHHPVLSKATRYLRDWRDVVDQNSDGWAHWSGGPKAAKSLMTLIQSGDATDAQLRKAIGPIKATATKKNLPAPELS